MEKVLKSGRIDYAKRSPYNNKVHVGNWFEDRCKFVKEKHTHISIYMQDYVPKPFLTLDPNLRNDTKFQAHGVGARLLFDHDGDSYVNNMSTLKDLSYNHCPKLCTSEPAHRHWRFRMERWEPEQDYCKNFGNLTDYGITEHKKQMWKEGTLDPRCPSRTNYQDMFQAPDEGNYKFKRWAIPRENSSILNKLNFETIHLRYRNKEINSVTPSNNLVLVQRGERCNPITWKCADDDCLTMKRRCIDRKLIESNNCA